MIDKVKHLLKHSFVYSISNVALKASGVILLPIYTSYFSVEDFGDLGLLVITILIFSQSLIIGQGLSLIRYNNSTEFKEKKDSIFFTLFLLVLLICAAFIFIGESTLNSLAALFPSPEKFSLYLEISIYIIAFTTFSNFLMSKLRADERSILYTSAGLIKLFILMGVAIYLIVVMNSGIEGVLYAQLAGEVSSVVIMLPFLIKQMEFKIETGIISKSLAFGFPLIFSTVAINFLNGSDKYIIKYLLDGGQLGIYELAYRIAGTVNMLMVMPIHLTFLPLAYKIYKREDDLRQYTKLKTYIAFLLIWSGLAVSIFSEELVKIFAQNSEFYPAFEIVPYIVLAYVIYGLSITSSLGMYLTGNNSSVAYLTIICAGINIGLNFLLIPHFGILAAAINTVIAFWLLDLLYYISSNRFFKIPYEHGKLAGLFVISFALYFASTFTIEFNIIIKVGLKLIVIALFPVILFFTKFYETAEIAAIRKSFYYWNKPKEFIKVLKSNFIND